MNTFRLKRGDTSPALRYALSPAVNLSGATVVFSMKRLGGGVVIDRAPASVQPASTVQYVWGENDTETAGLYLAEFEVLYADESVETFPNAGSIVVYIAEDIG
jgi:hypothetical protein